MILFVSWLLEFTPASIQLLPVLPAAAIGCHCGLLILSLPLSSFPLQHVDSLSNKKQMGDLCCRLLPNGANSHYSVCKLCLFSSSFTSTPLHHFAIWCVQRLFPMQMCHSDGPCFADYRIFIVIFSTKWETDIRHHSYVGLLIQNYYVTKQFYCFPVKDEMKCMYYTIFSPLT